MKPDEMLKVTKSLQKPSPHHITLAIWLTSANLISLLEVLFHLSLSLFFINLQFLFLFLVNKVKHKTLVFKKLSELTDEIKKKKRKKKKEKKIMFSLHFSLFTCMVNIPFKNGLSTKKDKKQQQILQIIPNLNHLDIKNWALFETLCSFMPEFLLCWVKCSLLTVYHGTRGCCSLKWHGKLFWKSVHVPN